MYTNILRVLSQPVHWTATYRCDDTRGCVMQFWPPDDEHMCSNHVEAWNKLIVKQKFCASSWLITEINNSYCISDFSAATHSYFDPTLGIYSCLTILYIIKVVFRLILNYIEWMTPLCSTQCHRLYDPIHESVLNRFLLLHTHLKCWLIPILLTTETVTPLSAICNYTANF